MIPSALTNTSPTQDTGVTACISVIDKWPHNLGYSLLGILCLLLSLCFPKICHVEHGMLPADHLWDVPLMQYLQRMRRGNDRGFSKLLHPTKHGGSLSLLTLSHTEQVGAECGRDKGDWQLLQVPLQGLCQCLGIVHLHIHI